MEKIRNEFEAIKNASWATTEFKLSAYEQMLTHLLGITDDTEKRPPKNRYPELGKGDAIEEGRQRVRSECREFLKDNPTVLSDIVRRWRGGARMRPIASDLNVHPFAVQEAVKMLNAGELSSMGII